MNACLDIKGKALDVPVCEPSAARCASACRSTGRAAGPARALRRPVRRKCDRPPAVRTLDDLKGAAREARERGFKAIKTNLLLFDGKGGRQFAPGMTGAEQATPSSTSPTISWMR